MGLILTAVATFAFDRASRERDAARFRNAVESTQDRIESRLDVYLNALVGARSFFAASAHVELHEFREYAAQLDVQKRYPGVQGIGYTLRVAPSEIARVEESIRQQGHAGFTIWPREKRDEYHSIVFLEPLDRRNRAAIGYDMFTEPIRREAMMRARDTGAPAISRRVTLLQEIDSAKQSGFLIYVPVYAQPQPTSAAERRKRLLGFIYSPFRAADFFNGIFGSEKEPRVAFEVFDGTQVRPAAFMYASATIAAPARYRTAHSIRVEGGTWTLLFHTTPAFDAQSSRWLVAAIFAAGLLASLVSFLLARSVTKSELAVAASEARTRAVLENALDAVVGMDTAGSVTYWNPHAEVIFGWRQEETLRQKMAELIVPASIRHAHEAGLHRFLTTGESRILNRRVETNAVRRDGSEFPAELSVTTVQHEKSRLFYAFIRDISDRKRVEHERAEFIEKLQNAIEVRDEFLSIAAHELRTPLTTLKLQLEALRASLQHADPTRDPAVVGRRVETSNRQVARLAALVNALINVSCISSGSLRLEVVEFDLASLVREGVDAVHEEAERAKSMMTVAAPDQVTGRWDRLRIEQVLANLLANALKYGAGKPIDVELSGDKEDVHLTVRDRGIGIEKEALARIFGRFERAVSSKHYGGLGLGLYIAEQIVAAHGGTIEVESRLGDGASFTVCLPRHNARSTEPVDQDDTRLV